MIPTTKSLTRNHLSCSKHELKLTYNEATLQKIIFREVPPRARAASNVEGGASYLKLLRASLLANPALIVAVTGNERFQSRCTN